MLDGGRIGVFNAKVMFELIISVEFTRWRRHSFFIIIHICIQCLGHFSPLSHLLFPQPSPSPRLPLRYQAETILPLSLILLKREYKQ
jgi:hypothetical protein